MFWTLKGWFYHIRAAVTDTVMVTVVTRTGDIVNVRATSARIQDGGFVIVEPNDAVYEFSLDKIQQVLVTVG